MRKFRITFTATAVALLWFLMPAQLAFAALSPADYIGQGIDHYGENDVVCGSGISGTLTGNSNTEKALNFMMQNGFTLAGASGVIGNWMQESGVRSDIIQGGATAPSNYVMVSGVGFGLAQWTSPGRQQSLAAFANKQSVSITDFAMQLQFFLQEFKNSSPNGYKIVTTASDPVQAAIDFHNSYEVSGDTADEVRNVRGANAQNVYDKYKDVISSTAGETNAAIGGCSTNPAGSVVWYSQTDPRWADDAYAGGTIEVDGCGPTSMAIILATLVDKNITPADVAAATTADQGNTKLTSYQPMIKDVNAKWGTNISGTPVSMDEAVNFLQSGKGFIWAGGTGDAPFTKSGHMVALVGVTSDGQITVADPFGDGTGHQHVANYSQALLSTEVSNMFEVPRP